MSRVFVFADEAGNFDFSRNQGASKYFILSTLTLDDCGVGNALLELRREMAFQGLSRESCLHATTDAQGVRNRVFALLSTHNFRVDATIFEKSKAEPQVKRTDILFYKYAWYLHFKYVAPLITNSGDELLITAASVGTKKQRASFHRAIQDVALQVTPTFRYETAFWPAESDPCLQVADYCTWAVQRKWELGDARSHALVAGKIHSEFDIWVTGGTHYY